MIDAAYEVHGIGSVRYNDNLGPHLLTRINFNPNMDK